MKKYREKGLVRAVKRPAYRCTQTIQISVPRTLGANHGKLLPLENGELNASRNY